MKSAVSNDYCVQWQETSKVVKRMVGYSEAELMIGLSVGPTLCVDRSAEALLCSLNDDPLEREVEVVIATYTFQVRTTARSGNCPKGR